jgi:hypothetical protein
MSQTAENILTAKPHLQIANEEIRIIAEGLSQVLDNESSSPVIENILFNKVTSLYYKKRVRLSFSLSDDFKKHFVMIRGLIEFHRSKSFSFHYDIKQKAFEADIDVAQLNHLQSFFNRISSWLKEEIRFKEALKIVLEFEHRYKIERASVYSLFKNINSLFAVG